MIHRQHQVWQAFGEPPIELKLHGLLPVFPYWVPPAYSFAVKLSIRTPEASLPQEPAHVLNLIWEAMAGDGQLKRGKHWKGITRRVARAAPKGFDDSFLGKH